MVNFPTQIPDCDSHSPALLDLFISSDASICSAMAFPSLGNSVHVVHDDYSHGYWDGVCDHLRDVPWKDIFKLSASAAASEFCEWLELMYISLIENIFQLLVLLPYFIEITSFVSTIRINLILN